jgi:hypothetical protein
MIDPPEHDGSSPWRHRVLDVRPEVAIEVIVADVDGDGRMDVVSGGRWYRAPDWEPFDLPGIAQAIAVMDVDGDGCVEIVGTRGPGLTSRLCWAKQGTDGWVTHDIGEGDGDWPHGITTLEDHPTIGRALVTSYHGRGLHPPQLWRVPNDPTELWIKSTLADLAHSEELVVVDLDGDGQSEIVAGPWWLDFVDGTWQAHRFADATYSDAARVRVADVDGDGCLDIILTEESGDWESRDAGLGRVAWFKAPPDIRTGVWTEHVIATKKCPHSVDVVDIDGDGRLAILVGEHDAFTPAGADVNAGLFVFRPADQTATSWTEEVVDTRFEHFNGARAIDLGGRTGIVSHGWMEPHLLHLWERA